MHADRLELLRAEGTRERSPEAERGAELARETWRTLEEFNLNPNLALEALFVQLKTGVQQRFISLNQEYSRSVKIPQKGLRDGMGAAKDEPGVRAGRR